MELKVNSYYDFVVHGSSILGANFRNALLKAELSYETAIRLDPSIYAISKQVYPHLPDGSPRDPKKYIFYEFRVDGRDVILANDWIVAGSIIPTNGRTYTITLTAATEVDVMRLRNQLSLLGLNFTIE